MPEPRFFRIRARQLGGHVHTTWWSARRVDGSYAGVGELVVDEHDWAALAPILNASPLINIITDPVPEDDPAPGPELCGSDDCIGMCAVVRAALMAALETDD